jgi:hypothetical protein
VNRDEHGQMRRGHLSGSHAAALMSGSYRTWNTLLKELRDPKPFYDGTSPATPAPLRWGKETEPRACAVWWERHPNLELDNPVCVAYHDQGDPLWARHVVVSPDRLIYDPPAKRHIAGLEVKCPHTPTKLDGWRRAGHLPREYVPQCAFGRLVTGLSRWLFLGYDPREPEPEDFWEVELELPPDYLPRMYEYGTAVLLKLESGGEFEPSNPTASRYKEMFHV